MMRFTEGDVYRRMTCRTRLHKGQTGVGVYDIHKGNEEAVRKESWRLLHGQALRAEKRLRPISP